MNQHSPRELRSLTSEGTARRVPGSGFRTLFYKELLRFWKVSFQTVLAPIVTALLYLTIFGHALSGRVEVYPGVE